MLGLGSQFETRSVGPRSPIEDSFLVCNFDSNIRNYYSLNEAGRKVEGSGRHDRGHGHPLNSSIAHSRVLLEQDPNAGSSRGAATKR